MSKNYSAIDDALADYWASQGIVADRKAGRVSGGGQPYLMGNPVRKQVFVMANDTDGSCRKLTEPESVRAVLEKNDRLKAELQSLLAQGFSLEPNV